MPSDVFWTGLFTFGGSVVGAGVGYVTALLQHQSHDRQLLFEERKLDRDAKERREENGGRLRAERRVVYLTYLRTLDGVLTPIELESVEVKNLRRRFDLLMEAHCELEVAGDAEINKCGYALNDLVEGVVAGVLRILPGESGVTGAAKILAENADAIRETRRGLIGLMSADVREEDQSPQ